MADLTALRRRMIEDMTIRNLSTTTQQSYVHAVARFSRFFGCSPDHIPCRSVPRCGATAHERAALTLRHTRHIRPHLVATMAQAQTFE